MPTKVHLVKHVLLKNSSGLPLSKDYRWTRTELRIPLRDYSNNPTKTWLGHVVRVKVLRGGSILDVFWRIRLISYSVRDGNKSQGWL